ncbi:ankyrin repeat domain-containing protein [Enterococcus larvae]|uniref:ankyrin repeat domain-containing protein n=1 Tax=Enterococcus larvae TaxID=2794352 RepID=UPI003F3F5140
MGKKRLTLPKDFAELCERGNLDELRAVYQTCELEAYTGYSKATAYSCFGIPEAFIIWLKEQGADINARDTYQKTALHHHAVYWKSSIEALLKNGASVALTDSQGNTPLHIAAGASRTTAVNSLLVYGTPVDVKNKMGQTPLEACLAQCTNASLTETAKVVLLLLESGAQKTSKMTAYVEKIGETFEFYRSNFNPESLAETETALQTLYTLFSVAPAARRKEHDGTSPIVLSTKTWQKQHEELWELLVPGSGSCQTLQGEVIRITGKVADEIFRNGGGNWDRDFNMMVHSLNNSFKTGTPLSENQLQETALLTKAIARGNGDEELARLSELAVHWVLLNPTPIALEKPAYKR